MEHNPFSTRYVRPGSQPFLFPPGVTSADLVVILRRCAWWGQITGPHGYGKSTLLRSLLPELQAADRNVRLIELHAGNRSLPISRSESTQWDDATQIVVDGYEQLSRLERYLLRRRCRKSGAGLLVTAHKTTGLPTMWEVTTSLELAQTLARRLTRSGDGTRIGEEDVAQAFQACCGDLRETWFRLYDVYEARSRTMPKVTVNAYANLRQYTAGQAQVEVDLSGDATIAALLEQLEIPADQTRIIFVDGRAAELDNVLQGGERVDLFSAIGGG